MHFSLTLDYIKLSQYTVDDQEILCSCVVLKFPAEKTVKPRIVFCNL